MEHKDYKNICELCIPIVREVGIYIAEQLGTVTSDQIEEKEKNSLVSYVDKEAERLLVSALSEILPEAGFITEEGTVSQGGADALWIIDPLDGTSNFLHGIPHFAVSVGLTVNDELKVGIVLDVMRGHCYYASLGGGAYRDGHRISVSTTKQLDNALIGTGFPYNPEAVRPLMDSLEYFVRHGRGIRRMGAAALDLVYVACGQLDIYYESTLHSWDIAGGTLILIEAGGKVSDFEGNNNYLHSGRIMVANNSLHPVALEVLKKNYG